jgi:hypothetical protein
LITPSLALPLRGEGVSPPRSGEGSGAGLIFVLLSPGKNRAKIRGMQ